MAIYLKDSKLFNIHAPFQDWPKFPLDRAEEFRVTEEQEDTPPTPPEGFSVEEAYYRTEDWETTQRPYIVYTLKPQEQLDSIWNNKIDMQIISIEQNTLLPRLLRNFLLSSLDSNSFEYKKVKEVDDTIQQLRNKRKT